MCKYLDYIVTKHRLYLFYWKKNSSRAPICYCGIATIPAEALLIVRNSNRKIAACVLHISSFPLRVNSYIATVTAVKNGPTLKINIPCPKTRNNGDPVSVKH